MELKLHADFEMVADPAGVQMGGFEGIAGDIDGLVRFWGEWLSAWESWVSDEPDFIEVDEDRILVVGEIRARSKTHQVELKLVGGNLITLRDGLVLRMEFFMGRAKALEAAGLEQ